MEMMKIKKALFFDIDGTLFSVKHRNVPDSAIAAIKKAREEGHLVFINSGRVYLQMDEIRAQIEVDGYLCGCGTYIRIGDEVLYHSAIPRDLGIRLKKEILQYGFDGVLEGMDGVVIRNEESHIAQVEEFRNALLENIPILPTGWDDHSYTFDKACIIGDQNSDQKSLFGRLKKDFDIIDRGDNFYEIVQLGHSKATAIDVILERYNIPLEQAYVFGDSSNDLPMFMHVPNAVLMAEHDKVLEPYASFTTKSVEDDGIAYAMEQLGII